MRVVLADQHHVVRLGVRMVLEEQGDIQVVGEASSAREMLRLVREQGPDVAVMDTNLPDGHGLAVVPALMSTCASLRILILSMEETPDAVRGALAAGVHGYVTKAAEPADVVRAVRSLAAGRAFLSIPVEHFGLGDFLPSRADTRSTSVLPSMRLSERERQVLELFAKGHTHREVADILGVRAKTVDTYRSRLGDKFGVRSRAELVSSARKHGFLQGPENQLLSD